MAGKIGDFFKGLRNEHPPLDAVLAGKVVGKQYRLVDLHLQNVSYNGHTQCITIDKSVRAAQDPSVPASITVAINPSFHDYMQHYGDKVRYITRNGTPWLTEEEKRNPQQAEAYFSALKTGPKQDVAIINWRKTDGRDTGHAAVSVGKLNYAGKPSKRHPERPRGIREYEQHAGGSFYPSQSAWVDRKSRSTQLKEARERDVGDHPKSHAAGVMVRNSAAPSAAAAGVAGAGIAAAALMGRGKKKRGVIRTALGVGAVATAAFTAGRVTNILQSSPGSVLIKDEDRGHGVLAALITDAQHDLLEHSLIGLGKTYHEHYNLRKSNCADFAGDMLSCIGLDTQALVEAAMNTEPPEGQKNRRRPAEFVAPKYMRPDRNQWAIHRLESGEEGQVAVEGQDIALRKLDISGQSALLIEAADGSMFAHPPLEMLSKVLAEGVGVAAPLGENRAEFAYSGNVRAVEAGQTR